MTYARISRNPCRSDTPQRQGAFPHSRALIVSGKGGRPCDEGPGEGPSPWPPRPQFLRDTGALRAAQRANAPGDHRDRQVGRGQKRTAPSTTGTWRASSTPSATKMGITIPVAIHADHYGIKNEKDLAAGEGGDPDHVRGGITSIAIDAVSPAGRQKPPRQHRPSTRSSEVGRPRDQVGEIKDPRALHPGRGPVPGPRAQLPGISPDWIALNNGTTTGSRRPTPASRWA